ncbi:tRNA (adenosine(37)-N6)-threonylcarbamoyltransferase complex ATPase subunit type 1 TsaE [Mycoplasmatota bacterium]|nr:tRNA (adenosine(37)-N6)-threonylcarbamoyltransferase complex ATPase subunit type 1 TsaE [Mycoplasmatota bacterium]
MKKYQVEVNNLRETQNLAIEIGKRLFPGTVITLEGDLGAGKTTFTKGIALALNINKTVNSPTFTIIKEYEGDLPLYHMDTYRISDDLEDLGFDEYFYANGVTLIEWARHIQSQLPSERLEINLYVTGETKRVFEFFPLGQKYEQLCEVLVNEKIID